MKPVATSQHFLSRNVDINEMLLQFIANTEDIFFVQIGANDGEKPDALTNHIKARGWRGLLVEPIPYLFEKLRSNYKGYEVALENVAIGRNNGTQSIYRINPAGKDLPDWYDGLASFSREVILSHSPQIPDIADLIIEETVQTVTFKHLVEKHNIDRIDILHIDTEGYDFEIIKSIDFNTLRPEVIIYEYCHLTLYSYQQSVEYLQSNGYQLFKNIDSYDIMAVDSSIL